MFNFNDSSIERSLRKREEEFEKLCLDQPSRFPEIGDTVIFAPGFLGQGYLWVREEAKVVNVAGTSVKIRYKLSYDKEYQERWVHPALITDILNDSKE